MSRILVLALVARCAALDLGDGCSGEVAKATMQLVQSLRTAMDTTAHLQRQLSVAVGENAKLRLALNESHVLLRQMNDALPKCSPPPAQVPASRATRARFTDLSFAAGERGTCADCAAIRRTGNIR